MTLVGAGHLGGRPGRRRRRAHRGRPGGRRRARSAYALLPAARPPRDARGVRRLLLPQQRRRRRRGAARAGGHERVAVVDIDAHHGNGTQAIFYDRADVLYASTARRPGRRLVPALRRATPTRPGTGAGVGATLNVPLAPGTGDVDWLDGVRAAGGAVADARQHRPGRLARASTPQPTTPRARCRSRLRGTPIPAALLADARPADGPRPGGRLSPADPRRSRGGHAGRVRELTRDYAWQVGSTQVFDQSPSSLSRRSPQQDHKQLGAAHLVSSPEPASGPGTGSVSVAEFGPNQWLVDELYQAYLADKDSVDRAWWDFFADYQPADATLPTARPPQDGDGQTEPATQPATAQPADSPALESPGGIAGGEGGDPRADGVRPAAVRLRPHRSRRRLRGSYRLRSSHELAAPPTPRLLPTTQPCLHLAPCPRSPSRPDLHRRWPSPRTTPPAWSRRSPSRTCCAARPLGSSPTWRPASPSRRPRQRAGRPGQAAHRQPHRHQQPPRPRPRRQGVVHPPDRLGRRPGAQGDARDELRPTPRSTASPRSSSPRHVNLGLAIDLAKPDGTRQLLVPSIKDADDDGLRAVLVDVRGPRPPGPRQQADRRRLRRHHDQPDQPRHASAPSTRCRG